MFSWETAFVLLSGKLEKPSPCVPISAKSLTQERIIASPNPASLHASPPTQPSSFAASSSAT